jgi:hypothetical protein
MLQRLEAAGFKKSKGLEGEEFFGDTLGGTIPASGVPALRDEPYLRTAILIPTGFELPTEGDATLLMRLELSPALGATRQPELADRVRDVLRPIGFQEMIGYDHRAHRRLLGRLPAGRLNDLLADNMDVTLPATALRPAAATVPAVKLATVLSEPAGFTPPPAPEPAPAGSFAEQKIGPDLRTRLADIAEGDRTKPIRVEVVLRNRPTGDSQAWLSLLTGAPYLMEIDGRVGTLVTGSIAASDIAALAADPAVTTVRVPQAARGLFLPAYDPQHQGPLPVEFIPLTRPAPGGLTRADLSAGVRRKTANKLVVLAADFRGFEGFVGKGLPPKTRMVDLTGEAHFDLQPVPKPDDGTTVGDGTRLAVAFNQRAAATEALLVRIDPAAPYQVEQVARAVAGLPWQTEAITARAEEIRLEERRLSAELSDLRIARRLAANNFGTDEEAIAARKALRARQDQYEEAQRQLGAKKDRFLAFMDSVRRLGDAASVLLALTWTVGHADLPGSPPVLRELDKDLLAAANWYQAVPRRDQQAWTGLFRDADGDGAMEFTAEAKPDTRPDLDFVGWSGAGAKEAQVELPAGAVVEVVLNWQEAHAADYAVAKDDPYREPLAPLKIVVLRQRDPSGQSVPADVFDVVARSPALPDRVENDPRWSVYQSVVRFPVGQDGGRYAIRIEGRAPTSTLPAAIAQLRPERGELRPKLTVDVADPASRAKGRAVLLNYSTGE